MWIIRHTIRRRQQDTGRERGLEMITDLGSNDNLSTCPICREIADRKMPQELTKIYGIEYRIIIEEDNFFVIPSVSPLKLGHIMIVPRTHISSMIQLPSDYITRFLTLKHDVLNRVRDLFGPVFCWEHGIGKCKMGGCGITHAHFHVLPMSEDGSSRLSTVLTEMFPCSRTIKSTKTFFETTKPSYSYLYWEFELQEPRLVTMEQIRSQLMRQLISEAEGLDTWDWREYTNWESFCETFQHLQVTGL